MGKKYDLAISFAGEERHIAERVFNSLDASGYSIFYDDNEKAALWGTALPEKLGDIYSNQARFCLMIISSSYINKMWTRLERRFAIQRMLESNEDFVLPLKTEDVSVPGIPNTTSYRTIDFHPSPESINEVCEIIIQKLGNPDNTDVPNVDAEDVLIIKEIINLCYTRAIFTKMDSEISLVAMFDSIGNTISSVQRLIIRIESQFIQRIVLDIVSKLDEIERYRNVVKVEISYLVGNTHREKIDSLKLKIIANLHKLRRHGKIMVQLPTTILFEHFFSIDDANKKPNFIL